jgi:signal peptidase I
MAGKERLRKVWRQVAPLLVLVLLLTSFRSAVADWNDVPTGSMKPTILEGDRIIVNKLAYGLKIPYTTWHVIRWDRPHRGEIVVFHSPVDGTRYVKRVVGLPGDVIELVDNRLLINGEAADYQPLADELVAWLAPAERLQHGFAREQIGDRWHPVMSTPRLPARRQFPAMLVPADHYFMLGDNRDNSADSRFIGTVHIDQITGRSSRVGFSLDYGNYYLPRWQRFLHPLP